MKKNLLACSTMLLSAFVYAVNVSTAEDFAAQITADSSASITLTADIDCSNWVSIPSFSGSIDGAGFKIMNLDAPLFTEISNASNISNIKFVDANIALTAGNTLVGCLAETISAVDITIDNLSFDGCSVSSTVKNCKNSMIAGKIQVTGTATIQNCVVSSSCVLSCASAGMTAGLFGQVVATGSAANVTISKCDNATQVLFNNSTHSFGGIAGNVDANLGLVSFVDCTNRSSVASTRKNCSFGGIAYSVSSLNSSNLGRAVFNRCINYGGTSFTGGNTATVHIGGILGYAKLPEVTVDSCINYGDLISLNESTSYIGGIIGTILTPIKRTILIYNTASLGNLNGYQVGGFMGLLTHGANYTTTRWKVISCIQTGEMTCRNEKGVPGGAVGMLNSGVQFPEMDFSGTIFNTDVLIGAMADGASTSSVLTDSCVYVPLSNNLVDGGDLNILNGYKECNLWKQGSNTPILKIMPEEPAPDIITVTFKDSAEFDSAVIATYNIARGGFVIPPADPAHDNFTFVNWSIEDFSQITEDTEIVATYLAGNLEYTVRFYDWDGSLIDETQTIQYGEDAIAPADPVREGYVFTGWDSDFTNVIADVDVFATYTIANVYIESAEDFATVLPAATVPAVTYHLKNDIVLPETWESIDFIANFNGGGYTISNLSQVPVFSTLYGNAYNFVLDGYNSETETNTVVSLKGDYAKYGAVATILDGGRISDVVVKNLLIKSSRHSTIGMIVSEMRNGAVIQRVLADESCEIRLINQSYVGGLVGEFTHTDVFAPKDENGDTIIGAALVSVLDSTNSTPIVVVGSGDSTAAGLVGMANLGNSTFKFELVVSNCVNYADITPDENLVSTSNFHIAGLVGEREYNNNVDAGVLLVCDCINYGDIYTMGNSGSYAGFLAHTYRAAKSTFYRCVNKGKIGGLLTPQNEPMTNGVAGGFIASLELYAANPMSFYDCANYGDVSCGLDAGGFLGRATGNGGHTLAFSFVNCANYGEISTNNAEPTNLGQAFVGLDVGMEHGTCTITVSNCLFTAENIYGRIAEQKSEDKVRLKFGNNQFFVTGEENVRVMNKELNTYAEENQREPWVVGLVDQQMIPELQIFADRIASVGTYIILK